MSNRGNQGQSGMSTGKWNKAKDKLGQIEAGHQHWWHMP
jgi:hypothetical protein